jgi:UDP-glucose 4-epimerase
MGALRCVITGATGAVGPAVANRFAREPDTSVVALARHPPPIGTLAAPIRFEFADLFDTATTNAVREADLVVHLAARLHINDPGVTMRAEYERTNIDATKRLIDATRPTSRFVFFSTIDVYGPTPAGAIATEDTPPQPRSLYGETKLRAEEIVLAHPGGVVLRLAAVYGPRIKANYARLLHALSRGRYIKIGPGTNVRTLVFEDDVAEAVSVVGSGPPTSSRRYNLTDATVHSLNDIVEAMSSALGRRPPKVALPAPLLRGAASTLDAFCQVVGRRSPLTPQMIDKLQENVAVAGDRLIRETNYRPKFDLARGWKAVVERTREHLS